MAHEERFEEAVRAGEKNAQAMELVRNWCAHVAVERFGGVGLLEMASQLPIGHFSLTCPHALGGERSYGWDLAGQAVAFYDQHCAGCSFRQAVGFPNLSSLVAERDTQRQEQQAEETRAAEKVQAEHNAREEARRILRAGVSAVVAATLDQISELDRTRDKTVADLLLKTAELAPETFPAPVLGHLFDLVDEPGLAAPVLAVLAQLNADPDRLSRTALRCMAHHTAIDVAARIITANAERAAEDDLKQALPNLFDMANPNSHQLPFERRAPDSAPLEAVFRHQPKLVRDVSRELLGSNRAFTADVAVRGLLFLSATDPSLVDFATDTLVAKLARSKWLVLGHDEQRQATLHHTRQLVAKAFHRAPERVDTIIQEYQAGASAEALDELFKVYQEVLRGDRTIDFDRKIAVTAATRLAFRQLIVRATETIEHERSDLAATFTAEPYDLEPLVDERIDQLLGSAAILFDKLDAADREPVKPGDMLASLGRMGRRARISGLAQAFVRWACVAAGKGGVAGKQKVLTVLNGLPEGSTRLHAAIIGEFNHLMKDVEGIALCLPAFYTALVGSSVIVRSSAATALGEMRRSTLENLPTLVFEAFLALMADPYKAVHTAAVRALRRFSLPEQFQSGAQRALSQWILYYGKTKEDDRFAVVAIDLYAGRHATPAQLAGGLGTALIDVLLALDPMVVAHDARFALRRLESNPSYPKLLLHLMDSERTMETYHEDLVELLRRLAPTALLPVRDELIRVGLKATKAHPYILAHITEVLSLASAWQETATLGERYVASIEDSARGRVLRHYGEALHMRAAFEQAVANGQPDRLEALLARWREIKSEAEQDREKNRSQRYRFDGFPGAR